MVKLSLSHLRRAFKEETKMTMPQYAKNYQLTKAKVLLIENHLSPIAEIAEQVGYEDHSHFSRDFKRAFEVTPLEHRRKDEKKE